MYIDTKTLLKAIESLPNPKEYWNYYYKIQVIETHLRNEINDLQLEEAREAFSVSTELEFRKTKYEDDWELFIPEK